MARRLLWELEVMNPRYVFLSILFSAVLGCGGNQRTSTLLSAGSTVTTVSLSTSAFDFGSNLVNNTLTQTVVTVTNSGSATLKMNLVLSGDPSYSINSGSTCGQQLVSNANCVVVLNYDPATASAPATQDARLNMGFDNVSSGTPQIVKITGTAASLPAGQVTATDNPQVALYTMKLPFAGAMTVNFGTDTSYRLSTWSRSTDTDGGTVSIFVAGMQAQTQYHMQAVVTFSNGLVAKDADHTFTTKAIPANMRLNVVTQTTAGLTPQPGLELLNPLGGSPTGVEVTDLSGNVLWTYADPGSQALNIINGVKMLPDGNLLMAIGQGVPATYPIPQGTINEIRESKPCRRYCPRDFDRRSERRACLCNLC
jgi:hypothetical protein